MVKERFVQAGDFGRCHNVDGQIEAAVRPCFMQQAVCEPPQPPQVHTTEALAALQSQRSLTPGSLVGFCHEPAQALAPANLRP
jgi:hypothetical protein